MIFVLELSILLQITATFLALRLIWITKQWAWAAIASAIALMAIRRSITLYHVLFQYPPRPLDSTAELVALVISVLMVVGIASIGPFFHKIIESEELLRQSEQKSKEGELFLSTVIDSILDGIVILDANYNILRVNPTLERWFAAAFPLAGKKCFAAFQGRREPCKICPSRQTLETGQAATEVVTKKDSLGETVGWLEIHSYPLMDPATGKVKGVVEHLRDITERKRAKETVRKSEERYRLLFDNVSDAVFVHEIFPEENLPGRFIEVNDKACQYLGYSKEELLQMTVTQIDAPETLANIPAIIKKLLAEKRIMWEGMHLSKDGQKIPVEISNQLFDLDGKPVILATVRNITKRKKAEEEKAQLEAKIVQSQKLESLGTLAGGIAHEFNNILAAIMGYAEMAVMELKQSPNSGNLLDYIKHILKASSRAKDLIRQILTFSRKENIDLKSVSPYHVVTETVNLLRGSIPKTIDIDYKADRSRGTILADPVQLQQIVMNLGTNAYQAMGQRGVLKIRLEEVIADSEVASLSPALHSGSYLRLIVADNGQGMDQETLAHIFDPFFTTKEVGRGTGLGLAVVHGIVKNMEGAITVQSEPGRGTTFTLYFPFYISPEDEETWPDLEPISGQGRILLVDDEASVAEIEARLLQKLGYEVIVINDSISALELFQEQSETIDLVITDQTMPKMTGMELALAIKGIRPGKPVILCSGYSDLTNDKNLQEAGIARVLTKPIGVQELSVTVKELLTTSG